MNTEKKALLKSWKSAWCKSSGAKTKKNTNAIAKGEKIKIQKNMENIEYKNHILRSLSCPLGGIFSLETKNE